MPRFSVIIPCRNESLTIEATILALLQVFEGHTDVEFVLVDNQSHDETWRILQRLASEHKVVKVARSPDQPGYGVAVKAGIRASHGTHLVFVMADGSEDPRDVLKLVEVSRDSPEACVFGNRFHRDGSVSDYPVFKLVANRFANMALRLIFRTGLHDLTNGFKLFPRSLIETLDLQSDDFSITIELSLGAVCSSVKIVEVSNTWTGRKAGESSFKLLKLLKPYLRATLRSLSNCRSVR
jgi:dolichol-phosphate mannosyltransferase